MAEPRQLISELSTVPEDRLSDWDKAFIATCAAVLENGEELDERRLEKLTALHADRIKPLETVATEEPVNG